MAINTRWEPNKVLERAVKILRESGHEMFNIDDKIGKPIPDGRGGWIVPAESTSGHFHDTGGELHIQMDPTKQGAIISYQPDYKTSSHEAQKIEDIFGYQVP